jgi:hypothetical protein
VLQLVKILRYPLVREAQIRIEMHSQFRDSSRLGHRGNVAWSVSALEIVWARQRLSQEWHVRQAWKLTCGSASMFIPNGGDLRANRNLLRAFVALQKKKKLRNVSRPRRCFDHESLVLRKVSTVAAQTCRLTHTVSATIRTDMQLDGTSAPRRNAHCALA